MKKISKYLIISAAVVAVAISVMSARTFFVRFPETKIWKETNNLERQKDFDIYVNKLSGGLKIPTISDNDTTKVDFNQFVKFRNYVQEQYPTVFKNVEYSIIDNNAMLLKWKGSNPTLKPILFNSHYDVVPAGDLKSWKYSPFSGTVQDGKIYGRGSIDMKGMLFSLLSSADILMKQGFKPERDIYFAFGYDEETNQNASKQIAKHLKSKNINFDAVYDEGGLVNIMNIKDKDYGFAMIGVAEKGYLTLKITVSGDGGHSSMPNQKTALGNASTIINRLEKNQMPANISENTNNVLKHIAGVSGFPTKFVIANNDVLKPLVIKQLSEDPATNALIRTTTAVTQIQGSDAENVIPNVVPIVVNFRLLPGEKIQNVIKHVEKQCKGFNAKIEIISGYEASKVSSDKTHGFIKMSESLKSVYPSVNPVPYISVSTGDSYNYGVISDNVYRFMPVAMTASQRQLIHSPNENISIENYSRMILYFKSLIQNYDEK